MKKLFFMLIGLVMLFSYIEKSVESSKSPPLTGSLVIGESLQVMPLAFANIDQTWLAPSIGGLDVKKDFCFVSLETVTLNVEMVNNDFMMMKMTEAATWKMRSETTHVLKCPIFTAVYANTFIPVNASFG